MLEVIEEAVSAPGVTHKAGFLALANDALALAMAALRLRSEPTAPAPPCGTQIVSMSEVGWHDHVTDCWVVVYDSVYNITTFMHDHPGGSEVLLEHGGRDATLAFRGIGHGAGVLRALQPYLVGRLPEHERIFASHGESKLRGLAPAADLPGLRLAAIL